MFCGNCGNKLNEGAKFCPSCGSAVQNNQGTQINNKEVNVTNTNQTQLKNEFVNGNVTESKANVLFVIASFFIPLLGLIFFVKDKDSNTKNSKACGIAGISGFAVNMIIFIISFAIGFIVAFSGMAVEDGNDTTNKPSIPSTTKSLPTKKVEESKDKEESTYTSSEDWKSYTVVFEGKEIKLPCSYSELASVTGYTMRDNLANSSLPKNKYGLANLYGNDKLALYTDIVNNSDIDILYKEGTVASIEQTTYQVETNKAVKIVFPGNLKIGDSITEEELYQKFGKPYKKTDYSGTMYQYVENESWTIYDKYEITLKDGVISELRLDHKGAKN